MSMDARTEKAVLKLVKLEIEIDKLKAQMTGAPISSYDLMELAMEQTEVVVKLLEKAGMGDSQIKTIRQTVKGCIDRI